MSDNQLKAGVIAGAVGLMVAGAALSGNTVYADASSAPGSSPFAHIIRYDGDSKTFTYNLDSFQKIYLKGAMELTVTRGDQAVSASMPEDAYEDISFKVRGDTLYIDMADNKTHDLNDAEFSVTIAVPTLEGFEVKGAVDARFEGLKTSRFELMLKGAGNIELDGSCTDLVVDSRGAVNVEAEDFKCENARIEMRGASNIEAWASKSANVSLKGLGNIEISGSPKQVKRDMSGLGSIDIR